MHTNFLILIFDALIGMFALAGLVQFQTDFSLLQVKTVHRLLFSCIFVRSLKAEEEPRQELRCTRAISFALKNRKPVNSGDS